MGSTYANVTVLGAALDAVKQALAGTGAHLAQSGIDVVVFSPHDEEAMGENVSARHLSSTLSLTVVDVTVFDEDFVRIDVLTEGEVRVSAVAPPSGAEIVAEMTGLGEVDTEAGGVAAELVEAVGRGDAQEVHEALVADNVFASESHHAIFAALALPTIGVGWGHRYIEQDRELFDVVPLVTA